MRSEDYLHNQLPGDRVVYRAIPLRCWHPSTILPLDQSFHLHLNLPTLDLMEVGDIDIPIDGPHVFGPCSRLGENGIAPSWDLFNQAQESQNVCFCPPDCQKSADQTSVTY